METIFSLIGYVILGFLVISATKKDLFESVGDTFLDKFAKIIVCMVVGAIVWSLVPSKCKYSNSDYDPLDYQKLK